MRILIVNLASTLGGALLFPFVWTLAFSAFAAVAHFAKLDTISDLLLSLGTWIVGDNSPYPRLALSTSGALFIVTYFVTVRIEYAMFAGWREWPRDRPSPGELRRVVFVMNAISYCGLIALFVYGTVFHHR